MFTWIKRGILSLAILGLLFAAPAQAAPPERIKVFIGFDRQPGPAEETLVQAAGGSIRYTYSIVPAIAASVPENAIAGLLANPRVTRVEPVRAIHAVDHSANTGDAEMEAVWGVEHIGSWAAHGVATGSGVAVAVIDSGIDCTHSDLSFNCVGGWDFFNNDDDPFDDNSHGTHVAGSIAAVYGGGNVVGVAPSADLVPLKVLNASGSGSFDDVVAALQWILVYNETATNPIRVTNNSYGASGNPGTTVEQAFDNAYAAGVLNIAAAGNSGKRGPFNTMLYPARFGSVVAVAATDEGDSRADFSSVGNEMELSAPGVSIYSTVPNNGYSTKSGTSMASPHAAGVAALVFSTDANLTAVAVRDVLKNTADDIGSGGWDRETGYGLVDADGAVGADGVTPDPNDPPTASFTSSCTDLTCDFDGSGSSDTDGSIASHAWDFGDSSTDSGVTTSHAYAAGGTYTVRLTVKDDDGASDSVEHDVTVTEPVGGGDFSLTATGYKVRGRQKVDLEWIGATSTDVDVYRNGLMIATVPNADGSYTDNIDNRGGATYTHQVCETGTNPLCSNVTTTVF